MRSLRHLSRREALIFASVLVAISMVARFIALFTDSANWDEFALLARSEAVLHGDSVVRGGRPGLAVIALVPLVRDCTNSLAAVVEARLVWFLFTGAYLTGVFFLVRNWIRRAHCSAGGTIEATVSVALLAFLPAFVTWSIQVRTDQLALATAAWGGAFLLGRRAIASMVAGPLFAVSGLVSQKGFYAIALCMVLFSTATLTRTLGGTDAGRNALRDGIVRAALATATGAATTLIYLSLVPEVATLASGSAVSSIRNAMDWARGHIGYRAYSMQAPRVPVHWALFAGLVFITVRSVARRDGPIVLLSTCWAVLAVAVSIAIFHGAGYPYFLMTVGLFAAVALGLISGRLAEALGNGRYTAAAVAATVLFAQALPETIQILDGRQAEQRMAFETIEKSDLGRYRGYSVEGANFCSHDPQPIPPMFTREVALLRSGPDAAIDAFIEEFRSRPVGYFIASHRMSYFPERIKEYWDGHFVHHSDSIHVAGFEVDAGSTSNLDVVVPGRYQWLPTDSNCALEVVGQGTVVAGGTIEMTRGVAQVRADQSGPMGRPVGKLMLDVGAPTNDKVRTLYDLRQILQMRGRL